MIVIAGLIDLSAIDTPEISPPVLELFRRYPWPGNIRQLANVLRTAAVMSAGERQVTAAHLSDDFLEDARRASAVFRPGSVATPAGRIEPFAAPTSPEPPIWAPPSQPQAAVLASRAAEPVKLAGSKHTLQEAEIDLIRNVMQSVGGNISAASKQLGISRNTIYRKLRWNVGDPPG